MYEYVIYWFCISYLRNEKVNVYKQFYLKSVFFYAKFTFVHIHYNFVKSMVKNCKFSIIKGIIIGIIDNNRLWFTN